MQTLIEPRTTGKHKYSFAGETFSSVAAVKARAKAIRERYADQDIPPDTQDFKFVAALLDRHVDPNKRYSNVGLFVAPAPDHPSYCFHVRREDGTTTDFGVGACLESLFRLNCNSLRQLVRPQVQAFKHAHLTGPTFISAWSGREFPAPEAVVDHDPTFRHVVLAFFSGRPENPEVELLTKGCDNSSEPIWKDPALAEAFLQHHSKTGLRLVAARENLSEIKKASA